MRNIAYGKPTVSVTSAGPSPRDAAPNVGGIGTKPVGNSAVSDLFAKFDLSKYSLGDEVNKLKVNLENTDNDKSREILQLQLTQSEKVIPRLE
jgi:hypothetical protein